jgi:hypothetical protein
MDPRDRFRPAFDGLLPAACGASIPTAGIRILVPPDDAPGIGAR